MNDLVAALRRLLTEQGVIDITLDAPEEDGSLGICVRYRTQIGVMNHLTAADSIDTLAERLDEIVVFDELDPR